MNLEEEGVADMPESPEALAAERIDMTLQTIEEARKMLETAADVLGTVRGMDLECRKVTALGKSLDRAWSVIGKKATKLRDKGRLVVVEQKPEGRS